MDVEIRGLENLKKATTQNAGVMITPNHSGHCDPILVYRAAEAINNPFYFMCAWQIFNKSNHFRRFVFRTHGCFSVDREGTDMRAFRKAMEILQTKPNPLVIFPEGEVYHTNDRITPFRDGAAAIALTALKRSDRPIFVVPCAIKYLYTSDPTPELVELMSQLEKRIIWRPTPHLPLPDRVYRFAQGLLSLKEIEYLGQAQAGALPARISFLSNKILFDLESRYDTKSRDASVPERVKAVRREIIKTLEEESTAADDIKQAEIDLDDLFIVIQLFSYPGDYVAGKPSIERLAETLDKFEEDILDRPAASIRATRRVILSFAEPIAVQRQKGKSNVAGELTETIEKSVQQLLDDINASLI
jgi:1-acyl-sn-glycerol-3-phosphate acyltransferase